MPRFVPRQRKHKVLARQRENNPASTISGNDSNASIILPQFTTTSEKEQKRQKLRQELRPQNKISSKKQKRLEKYIDNRLKKDEAKEYVRKLEQERERFNVGHESGFLSSKDLNGNKTGRKRRFEDFVNGQKHGNELSTSHQSVIEEGRKLLITTADKQANESASDDDESSVDSFEASRPESFGGHQHEEVSDAAWLATKAPALHGTGLAKPLQVDANGLPIIQMRGKKRQTSEVKSTIELPWEGFESEAEEDFEEHESGTEQDSEEVEVEDSELDDSIESDSEDSNSSVGDEAAYHKTRLKPRASAFKTWATTQLNQAVGHTPSYAQNGDGNLLPAPPKKEPDELSRSKSAIQLVNGLPEVKANVPHRQIHSIHVERTESINESRSQLPILRREQEIMEAIHSNPVVVIKGETGSGKTTQLPQFLFEAGYGDPSGPNPGMIGITQPRRVAAVSMAKRVGEELGPHGGRVSHQVRFDSTVSTKTAIKFMTDGILLRELSQDLLLKKYSAIVIDEAHERSVNTDILIGMLSKIVPARMRKDKFNPDPKPLKLIIMSATLNIEDFLHEKLFSANLRPPVVEAEGRQHRVTTHFALRTRADYLEESIEKVKRAHKKLPRGGILVFLTGKNEIQQMQARLCAELRPSVSTGLGLNQPPRMHVAANEMPMEMEDFDFESSRQAIKNNDDEVEEVDILTHSDQEQEEHEFDISDDEEETNADTNATTSKGLDKTPYDCVHIIPLYSQLPTKDQLKVFEPPPDRARLIVLATNIAETSLTIPGIKYVFDCGRSKERKYNLETGVQRFEIDYISKASAQQRAGRAGRTGPGHCWRLYTSAIYEQYFPEHNEPEIVRAPAESVVLQIKGFAYPRPVVEFPFPTPPGLQTLGKAEKLLQNLGALNAEGIVTKLGQQLSLFPLSPRLGKILSAAITNGTIGQAIALVSGLTVSDIYLSNPGVGDQLQSNDDGLNSQKQAYGRAQATMSRHDKTSDIFKLLTAVTMYENAENKSSFCAEYFLRPKAMSEVLQLVQQLRYIIQSNHTDITISPLKDHKKVNSASIKQINSTAASGYVDQVAIRWDHSPNPPLLPSKPRRTIDVPYLPLIPLNSTTNHNPSDLAAHAVFIHPTSLLSRLSVKELPEYIVYTHLQSSQAHTIGAEVQTKTRMYPLAPIDGITLARLARGTALLSYGKPVPKTKIEELPGSPRSRMCWVSTEIRGGGGGHQSWPLPPTKVKQVMDVKSASGWRVEEFLS